MTTTDSSLSPFGLDELVAMLAFLDSITGTSRLFALP